MKIIKRKWGCYSVLDKQGREVAVFNYYKSAMRYVKSHKGGR